MMQVHLPPDDAAVMTSTSRSEAYAYHLRGELSELLLSAFPDLAVTRRRGETILTGPGTDQAALFGVLSRIEALGIHLIEVRRTKSEPERSEDG